MNIFLMTGNVPAIDSLWIIGDEFIDRSFTEHLRHARSNNEWPYIIQNFDVFDFSTTRYLSSLRNIIARLIGLLVNAICTHKILPKAIIFVPDDDIIRQINYDGHAKDKVFNDIVTYLVDQTHWLIMAYKEKLPKKSKHQHYHHILWITLPCKLLQQPS